VVGCTDCHYSLNNPVFYQERGDDKPSHLVFDPRRLDISDYLQRPLHQFAKGSSAQGLLAPELNNTIRACESCHSIATTHTWLPYKERHVREVACETCHIPTLYAPALESVDWTVLQADATPRTRYRGVEGGQPSPDALITGFQPVLLTRTEADGTTALAPHNLVTAWYWVYGDPARPVPLHLLKAAWLVGDGPTRRYAPDVLATFDADANGALSDAELFIDSDAKQDLIAGKLSAQGLANPRIASEVQPYGIHHDVARGEWAIRECQTCHTEQSRLEAPLTLADRLPGGVTPELSGMLQVDGTLSVGAQGDLSFSLKTEGDSLHVFGNDRQNWIDTLGTLLFVGTFLGVLAHGGLRYITSRRRAPHAPNLRRVYMYSVYERQWHWLQTALIFILIFTGLVIHKPHLFGAFSFPFMVEVHNVTAILLLINAALAAFYHFASGEIKQFLPRPYGFFNHMFLQARYYVWGIFRGEDHPFAKSRERKMNPLQQVTYLMLLNVLLPLQVITGALMMGAQQWPDITQRLGGMPLLAPFHTAIAWALSSFIVLHVYLTTTGHTPTSNIQAMITGWDAVEAGQDGPVAAPTSPALEPSQD
jgi:thiosulfate reductase cytochrome b subunit